MDLDITDEQRLLKDSVERFVKLGYDFAARKRIVDSPTRFSADVWRQMAQFGWLALPLPEADGGLGGSAVDVSIVTEGLGAGLVLEPYLSCAVVAGRLMAEAGSTALRQQWLPPLAAGQARLCFAHTEPGLGYLSGARRTTARRKNDTWTLDGCKTMVIDGPGADAFIVSAQSTANAEQETLLFVVPRDAPGLVLQSFESVDGRLGSRLDLSGVTLDRSAQLTGSAQAAIDSAIDHGVAALCAEAVGAMQVLLDTTVAYTKTRVQFGQPIGANQVLKHRMVDMAMHVEEARAMALRVALKCGSAAGDPEERARAASGAKLKIARGARFVGEHAIQLHGAMGVTEELNIGAYFKRLLAFEMTLGTSAEHMARAIRLRPVAVD